MLANVNFIRAATLNASMLFWKDACYLDNLALTMCMVETSHVFHTWRSLVFDQENVAKGLL